MIRSGDLPRRAPLQRSPLSPPQPYRSPPDDALINFHPLFFLRLALLTQLRDSFLFDARAPAFFLKLYAYYLRVQLFLNSSFTAKAFEIYSS